MPSRRRPFDARARSTARRRFRGIGSLRSAERTGIARGTGITLRPSSLARPLCHVRQLNRTPRPIEPILRSVAFHAERFDRGNTLLPPSRTGYSSCSEGSHASLDRPVAAATRGRARRCGRLAPIHLPSNGITRNARALCLTCSVRVFVPLERCPRPPRKAE